MAKKDDFINEYGGLAQYVGQKLGVDPSLLIAQWALETGWGKSVIPGTNNLGNIKDFRRNSDGVTATDNMNGSVDKYRKFATPEDFGDHFAGLIQRKYPNAIGTGSDARAFATALKEGGYAEDPDYVNKIVATTNNLPREQGWLERAVNAVIPAAHAGTLPEQPQGLGAKMQAARQAGYSDAEIAEYLGRSQGFAEKLQQARDAGYSDQDIYGHLGLDVSAISQAFKSATAKEPPPIDPNLVEVKASSEPVETSSLFNQGVFGQPKPGLGDEIVNGLGVGARNVIEGLHKPYDIVVNGMRGLSNEVFGTDYKNSNAGEQLANFLGLPKPQSEGMKAVSSIQKEMANPTNALGGMIAGLGRGILGKTVSGAASGAASAGMATEATDDRGIIKDMLVGGAVGGVLNPIATKISDAVQKRIYSSANKRIANDPQRIQEVVDTIFKDAGVDPADIHPAAADKIRSSVTQLARQGKAADGKALLRQADFDLLGITPTQGQLTRDPFQFTQERNLRGIAMDGRINPLMQRFSEQNTQLNGLLNDFGAGGALTPYEAGNIFKSGLLDVDAPVKDAVGSAYSSARDSAGRYANLNTRAFSETANNVLDEQMLGRFLPDDVRGLLNDVSSGKVPLNVNNAVQIDSVFSDAQRKASRSGDNAAAKAIGAIRTALNDTGIDDAAGQEAKGLFDLGRQLARERFSKIEASPAYKSALNDDDVERVFKAFMGGTTDETGATLNVLRGNPAGAAADKQFQAQFGNRLSEAAFGQNLSGDKTFSPERFAKTLADNRSKLALIYSPEQMQQLDAMARVGSYINSQPAGSAVNTSNTGSAVVNSLLDSKLMKLPFVGDYLGDPIRRFKNETMINNAINGGLRPQIKPFTRPDTITNKNLLPLLPALGGAVVSEN